MEVPDECRHEQTLSTEELMWLRYHRECALKDFKRLKAPTPMLDRQAAMVDEITKEMATRGLTEADYKQYCDTHWEEHLTRDMNIEIKDKCLVWMRHVSTLAIGEFKPAECTRRNESCALCKEFEAATEEQYIRYLRGDDVDTGERMPLPSNEEILGEPEEGEATEAGKSDCCGAKVRLGYRHYGHPVYGRDDVVVCTACGVKCDIAGEGE